MLHPTSQKSDSAPLDCQLRLRFSKLSYFAFAMCVARLLRNLGYRDIPIPSRRSFRGPNSTGGVDLTASHYSPLGVTRALIQLKQYRGPRPVSRRAVDEFRGVMLRESSPEGLLITTSIFSEEAIDAAGGYPGRPVRLIDGNELGRLAQSYKLGLIEREHPVTGVRHFELDEQWFKGIELECMKLIVNLQKELND